jgi:hypothetical protein
MIGILAQAASSPANWGIAVNKIGMSISATWFVWVIVIVLLFTSMCTWNYITLLKKSSTR